MCRALGAMTGLSLRKERSAPFRERPGDGHPAGSPDIIGEPAIHSQTVGGDDRPEGGGGAPVDDAAGAPGAGGQFAADCAFLYAATARLCSPSVVENTCDPSLRETK